MTSSLLRMSSPISGDRSGREAPPNWCWAVTVTSRSRSAGNLLHEHRLGTHDRTPSQDDPPTEAQIDEAIQNYRRRIDEAFPDRSAGKARTIIGVSGTVTTTLSMKLTRQSFRGRQRTAPSSCIRGDDRFLRMPRGAFDLQTIHPGRVVSGECR